MKEKIKVKKCWSCGSDNISIRDYGSGGMDAFCEDCGAHDYISRWNKRPKENKAIDNTQLVDKDGIKNN